jgi:NRAMP (natural resistance-associated macrophage protein)-like metal ion transporter
MSPQAKAGNSCKANVQPLSPADCTWQRRLLNFFVIAGPGYMAMLADTDVGSVVTAAQSGARWGYRLLWIQLIFIPILYWVQELTVRLGLATGKGQGRLIREHFGSAWALITAVVLFISVLGALVTEFVGIAGAGMLFHIPPQYSVGLAVIFLLGIVLTGSYRRLELIGIAVGLFEISLVAAAYLARPELSEIKNQFFSLPLGDHAYVTLIAANVGAIIMPWMIFYQQGAIVDKGLYCACEDNYQCCRWDTAIGSVFAQAIMIAALVLTAATIGKVNPNAPLNNVEQIADAIIPLMGEIGGKVLFAAGITSAALIGSIVVSMAAAWGVGDLIGMKTSFNRSVKEAPAFYITYGLGIVAAGVFVLLGFHLVEVTILVEIVNALMLPLILGFLFLLAFRVLPPHMRLTKWHKGLLGLIYVLISLLGIFTVAHFFMF